MNKKNLLSIALIASLASASTIYSMDDFGYNESSWEKNSGSSKSFHTPTPSSYNNISSHDEELKESSDQLKKQDLGVFNPAFNTIKNVLDRVEGCIPVTINPIASYQGTVDTTVIKQISAEISKALPSFKDQKSKDATIKKAANITLNFLLELSKRGDCSPEEVSEYLLGKTPSYNTPNHDFHYIIIPSLQSKKTQQIVHSVLLHIDSKILDTLHEILIATDKEISENKAAIEKNLKGSNNSYAKKHYNQQIKEYLAAKALLNELHGYVSRARNPWIARITLLSKSHQILLSAGVAAAGYMAYQYLTNKKTPIITEGDESEDIQYEYIA